jgi:hypothetical protein
MIASAIAAGFAGMVVVFKMGFRRFIGLFSRKSRAAAADAPETEI